MANDFQKQLLKAGLVTKDKVAKANKQKHKKSKQQAKNAVTESDERKLKIQQDAITKAERDRELNKFKVNEENKKAITAQIIQLVELNRISSNKENSERDEEIEYNFEVSGKIKKIYVNSHTRNQIINGRLAIVTLNNMYEVVPKSVADKISQRDASFVVLNNDISKSNNDRNEDDEYADFIVPDDLMW